MRLAPSRAAGVVWDGNDRKMVPTKAVGVSFLRDGIGVIMRCFFSGRRFSCLEVLLALLLSAPISLSAQSGSSPRSQPAQSAASAPAPSTPSQAQSRPPCADAPPILKRGKQVDLPPCPDPPPAASPPADSVPTPALTPTESLIERARE